MTIPECIATMPAPTDISAILVMGVSGSGKSTIAQALARRIGFLMEDGDAYHPAANVKKMHDGIALSDADRWPWLRAIAVAIDRHAASGARVVIACSALKRSYREMLIHGRDDVRIVYLKGSRDLIAQRMRQRSGHFMPLSLLDSQFAALEEPGLDEHAITVDIDAPVETIVATIIGRLALSETSGTHS